MRVLVVGANGQTGKLIVELLIENDHEVKAMIRKAEQASEFEKLGATPVIADLAHDVNFTTEDCQAVVFAAGANERTTPETVQKIDQEGAIKMIEVCEKNGIDRFILISAMGTGEPDSFPENLEHYLTAKAKSEKRLTKSKLNYTILRPGQLTDDPETGKISASEKLVDKIGQISRLDVATTIVNSLENEHTYRKVVELIRGNKPIEAALNSL